MILVEAYTLHYLLERTELGELLIALLEQLVLLLFGEHPHRHAQQIVELLHLLQLLEGFLCDTNRAWLR